MANTVRITALTEVYGSGQKLTAVCIEYPLEIHEAELSKDAYQVEGLRVTGVYVTGRVRGGLRHKGRFVVLAMDTDAPANTTLEHIGRGPNSRLNVRQLRVSVSQLYPLRAVNGQELPPFWKLDNDAVDNGIVDRFSLQTFQVSEGRRLDYQMYAMERRIPGHKYPLVLFMHDAGSCSDDAAAPLAQGSGAVVWARDALFGRRPCYVVAPCYPSVCANDDFEVTWQADATVALIRQLAERYPIDTTRIYGTGQSMGCMMLCEMVLRNPKFFAGCLLVAGQWNPERMAAAKDENLWAVVSQGDEKAFPIMGEAMGSMEAAGGRLSRSYLDAKADASVLDAQIRLQKARGCNLNFSWFEGSSILPPGAPDHSGPHHVSTWHKAYDIKALREWLFEQRGSRMEEDHDTH